MQTWGVVEIKVFKKQQGDGRKLQKKKQTKSKGFGFLFYHLQISKVAKKIFLAKGKKERIYIKDRKLLHYNI